MDLFDIAKISAKRWFVFLPILLIAVYYAYGSYSNVKPVYYTSVSIGIVLPSVKDLPPQPTAENPGVTVTNGLADSGGVSLLANLLTIGLQDAAVRSQVSAAGGYSNFSAEVFTLPSAGQLPIVVISSSGADKARVAATVDLASAQAQPTIRSLQAGAGVPENRMVSAYPLSSIPEPYGALPSRTREAGAIIAAGLVIALVAAVSVDAVLQRVRKSRRRKVEASAGSAPRDGRVRVPN